MESTKETPESSLTFKKPMLVGKIGRLPKKLKDVQRTKKPEEDIIEEVKESAQVESPAIQPVTENTKSLPYEEPKWSGLPTNDEEYSLEVLKNGSILETINLSEKSFFVFGRLSNCDICMQHPTISRYHAVLQYRNEKNENYSKGYYIYDLESTHGTFLNKNRIKPRNYVKMHVGHMLKLGCSTRTYILNGPEEDKEEESELTVTELKQKRQLELLQRQQEKLQEEERKKKEEEKGIDWGMGEDADEDTDLSENPYAQTNNEDLYIDNPKKTLRGFFEREGLDLEYDCTEQGIGQFLCKIELPIDDEVGRPIFAEVIHKGKKKEAVVQCALEACRILDRHGLLRQATHESRKRKPKNWEENDYYDSDDDTFLDRTGSIEKKREKRMNAKVPLKAETYENLLEKEKKINKLIKDLETKLVEAQRRLSSEDSEDKSEADPLDSFMMELKQSKPSKQSVHKLKSELIKLKQEHATVIKLVNIAKPASLPPLVAEYTSNSSAGGSAGRSKNLPIFGKRKKIKLQLPEKPVDLQHIPSDVEEEEMEEENEEKKREERTEEHEQVTKAMSEEAVNVITEEKKGEEEAKSEAPSRDKKEEIKEDKEQNVEKEESSEKAKSEERKKNRRRTKQSVQLEETAKKKGYSDYESSEDYSMWVPPSNQTGDGRTSLNDKYGY